MHECRARPHRCVMHTCKVEGPWNVRGRFLARYRQARVIADRAVRWSKAVCQQQGGEDYQPDSKISRSSSEDQPEI